MFCKVCSYCDKKSYSASSYSEWKCPYCGKDISYLPAKPAGNDKEKNKGKFKNLSKN